MERSNREPNAGLVGFIPELNDWYSSWVDCLLIIYQESLHELLTAG
jgi:hypothetical protein